jgi:hypothetical protein
MIQMPGKGAITPPRPYQEIASQQRARGKRPVFDAAQGERHERDDNQRIENDGRENGALRRVKAHDVEAVQSRVGHGEHGRDDREVFRYVVSDGERGERAARYEQLLADGDDFDELGGIAVEIDHVAGFFRGHGARVHRDTDVGLGERGSVVSAVAGHRDQAPAGLFTANKVELVFRRGLREEVVDAGFAGNCSGGERVIARDHDGADAHGAHLREAFAHAAFHDVLEVDDAEEAIVFGDHEWRAAQAGDAVRHIRDSRGVNAAE